MRTKILNFSLLAAISLASIVFNACKKDEPTNTIIEVAGINMESALFIVEGRNATLTATITPYNAIDTTITWTSSNNAIATVDPSGKVNAVAAGTAFITAKAGNKTATCRVTVEGVVVINGVMWATCNVGIPGTFAATPESAGMLYQWNRKIAYNATYSPIIGWDATTPKGTTWEKANDPSPEGWRIPTREEQQTLFDTKKVANEWTTQNGVSGCKFTDKTTGASLFLPAVGKRNSDDGTFYYYVWENGGGGFYWSSTPNHEALESFAYYAYFYNHDYYGYFTGVEYDGRSYGHSVRCVLAE